MMHGSQSRGTRGAAAALGLLAAVMMVAGARAGELEALGDFRGRWLRSGHAQVFIAVRPVVRVLAFRRSGGRTLMATDPSLGEVGLRVAFMEPTQIPGSFGPGNQPGEFLAVTEASATVRAAVDEPSGLQLEMDVSLRADAAVLDLTYRLINRGEADRRIAVWSVTALPRAGIVVAPFGVEPRSLRRVVYAWWTKLPQAGLGFGRDALVVDFEAPLSGRAFKVGLATEAGWVAAIRDGRALVSRVAYVAGGDYPEGGANLTVFQFDGEDRQWCEIEQVGPLTTIDPGEAAAMSETLTLTAVEAPAGGDPDAWREALEAALHATP